MATVTQCFPKILKMLRENSNTKEKREALTYIRSNAKKLESSGTIKEEQYKDLCKLVIDASTSKDHNVQHEAYDTLNCVVQDFRSHKLNLFESMLQINRKDRLKILKLLDVVDDVSISIAAYDMSILNLLNDCMHSVQPVIMDWFLPNACTDNLQKLTEVENRVLSDEQKLEEEMVNYSLNLLRRLYKVANTMADNKIQRFHKLLMDKVVLLAYMGHKRQRSPALKVLQQAIMTNFVGYVRTELRDIWMQYKTALQSVYCKRMQLLVTACDCDWAVQWNISVQLLGTDLHRGANIINNLLSVEERAFKSADAIIRRQAFLSWKLLIDNFALDHQELATTRRIKLLCIPLSAKNSKTELIALTKLEVWWHLIIKLYKDIVKFVDPVITQFLNFCFGPLGDTPLLSSKCDVAASPGKKFFKTKLVAVDALCQLLVGKQENHSVHPSILEETLPQCICGAVFQECYKSIIHSVGEALLILSQLNDKEMKKRCQIGKLLWSSLVNYAQESMEEIKDLVYKDILLVINELVNYIADKPMIKNLMLDVVIFELPNFNRDIQIHGQMLSDLLFKLLSPPILLEIKTNHCKGLECLLWECVKSKMKNEYRSDMLGYLRTVLEAIVQVDIEIKSITVIPEIWCIVTKILTKYIEDSGNINEGNAAHHNFKNTEYILKYPFMHIFLEDSNQIQEISEIWKKLYKQFDLQADLIVTVKANEVLLNTVKMIQCCLNKNKDCACLAVTCLDALLNSINYNSLLAHSEIPSIVEFLTDLTRITFNNSQFTDCDITLRALSAVVITVYGHNAKKAVLYLQYLKPVIELVLLSSVGGLLKEITSMWETVISIFKGLGKSYSFEILSLYKELIIQAINHSNIEIAAQTLAFLDEASNFDDKAQYILEEIHKKIKLDKLPFKLNNVEKKLESIEKSTKQVKMTGSFLNRKSAIPKIVLNIAQKEKDGKGISIPDPESQEYVYIKPDIKYDVNRLTEHQKEVLKKKRDDIPALYNDLSQSSSQSSQHLQEWFDKRVKHISEVDYSHNVKKNDAGKEETIDHDDNKENTIDSVVTEYSITDKTDTVSTDLKLVQHSISPVHSTSLLCEDSKSNKCSDVTAADNTSKDESSSISKVSTNDALGTSFEVGNEEAFDPSESDSVVKRLNFESRDEFPNEKDLEQPLSPSVLDSTKRRNRSNTIKTNSNDLSSDKATNNQTEQNGSKMARTLRPKSSLCKTSINNNTKDVGVISTKEKFVGEKKKGTKRKYASDSDCEENTHHRRRKKLTDSSETSSDTDCGQSVGTERTSSNTEEQGLSQRTKNEISRLKINMVFNSPLPSRRRSKPSDEMRDFNTKQLSENKGSRHKNAYIKNSEMKKTSKVESQEELKLNVDHVALKKKKRRSGTIEQTDSDELHMANTTEEAAEKAINILEMKVTEGNENMNECSDSADIIITDNISNDAQVKTMDMDTSSNSDKVKDDKKKLKRRDSNTNEVGTADCVNNEEQQTPMDDENEEIIQNSQEVNVISSRQEGKYNDKQCFIKIDKIDKIIHSSIVKSNDASTKDILTGLNGEKKSTKEIPNVPTKIPGDASKNDDTIEEKIDDKIDDKIGDKIDDKIDDKINDKIDDKIDDKSDDKIDDKVDDKAENKTENKNEDKIEDKIDETMRVEDNTITTINSEDEKKISDTTQVNTSPTRKALSVAISSPKNNVKRFTKIKTYAPQGGRAAHMLGLVTKQALAEINSPSVKADDDSIIKRFKTKDGENEVQIGKKDKASIFKDNEKIGGPCSSRQEKIFNNMKSGEYLLSSPVKSFPNLKNDGEKISPNVDKAIPDYMLISLENTFEKGNDGNLSPSHEKTELPMLEWSSANPPSLTASPSASILKRHRLSMPECEVEATTPNKRKRVSFADPPVSKQMGYEITLTESPHKTTKLSSRALMFRKDSPSRLKQTKLKFIHVDPEKLDKNVEIQLDHGCEVDLQCERENALLTKMAEELEFSENMVIDVDNHTTCGFSDNVNDNPETNKNLCTPVTINNLSQEIEIRGEDMTTLKESKLSTAINNNNKSQSEESETQQDIFGSVDYKSDVDKSVNSDRDVTNRNDSIDSSSLNMSNVDTENLEDTVDIGNITGLNSTVDSDEIFCGKPFRTSTQTAENIADQDTLPVTDSIFGSLPLSQASESTGEIPQPELLDDKKPICSDLITCKDPIDSIIGHLTNPLWVQSLSNYFSSRNIRSIGDLAQLTEREINRIPVRGNPKVDFVRNVLKRRSTSNLSETKARVVSSNDNTKATVIPSTYDNLVPTENCNPSDCNSSVIPDTENITETTANVSLINKLDVSCQTEGFLNTQNASTMTSGTFEVALQIPTIYTDSVIYLDIPNETTRETKSVGVSTDPMSPIRYRKSRKLTKSVGAQMSLEDLLDEIDVKLVMQNAVKRSSSESILTQYKLKTRNLPESDLEKEALKVFGPENKSSYYEAKLKSSCRACGVNKVLLRLPDIFSGDKQFFNKVLSTYRKKITMSDCMNVFNFKEVKDFMCQKCTSSELAEILSTSLKEEEKRGIKSPMRELSCFSALLKRVPKDVVISHTVANEELIQPQLVLDIAMQNSSSADITRTLELQSPSITKDVFDKLWSSELVLSHIETKSERTELLKIYKAISTKLSPKELLEVYHESMMAKLPPGEDNQAE